MSNDKLLLGYWDIRGFAQHIRFLLEYTGANWEEKLYHQEGREAVPPFTSDWVKVKHSLDLDFPNLPYLIDGNLRITQSKAILRYIGRKFPDLHLLGRDDHDMAHVDMLLDQFYDINGNVVSNIYDFGVVLDFINGTGDHDLPNALKEVSNYLGSKAWFLGDYLTVIDFVMYEYVSLSMAYTKYAGFPDYFSSYPALVAFHSRFSQIPSIESYLKSDRFAAVSVFNNPVAKIRLSS